MVLLRSCRHLKTIRTMSTMRTVLLAALCCVCLALPFPRLQRKRRDTGDDAPGPELPAQNISIEEFTTNSPEPTAQNISIEEFTTNSPEPLAQNISIEEFTTNNTQKDQSWFNIIYEANNGILFTGRYIIRHLDVAYRIGRSAPPCQQSVCLWPKSSDGFVYIPYTLSSDFGSYGRMVIAASLSDMEAATCIRFRPQTSEADYISFQPNEGCWASIGNIGGAQTISLDPSSCLWSGTITHEVLHALGLHHEHVRSDRDSYVQVQWNNIKDSGRPNFLKSDTFNEKLTNYDYQSIMHYTNTAFSSNGLPTLVPIPNNNIQLGEEFSMSDLDILKINTLYQCSITTQKITIIKTSAKKLSLTTTTTKAPRTTTTTTRAPRTTTTTTTRAPRTTTTITTTTRAPSTTTTTRAPRTTTTTASTTRTTTTKSTTTTTTKIPTSRTSTTKAPTTTTKTISNGCGGNLTAPEGVFTSPNYPNDYPNNANCHWNITTNTKFRVTFTDFDIESENYDCLFDKLRIYNGIGFNVMYQLTDLCGQNLPSPITSYGSSMQFVFISDPSKAHKGFRVVYSPI